MYCIVWQGVRRAFIVVQTMFDKITLASFLRWRAALHVISLAAAAAALRFGAARGAQPLYQIRWAVRTAVWSALNIFISIDGIP